MYVSAASTTSTAPFSSINLMAIVLKEGSTNVDTLSRHLHDQSETQNLLLSLLNSNVESLHVNKQISFMQSEFSIVTYS